MSIFGNDSAKSRETAGLIAGVACFTIWGLIPIYWKLIGSVPASEILAHRFVWTSIFLSVVLTWQKRWAEVKANVRSRRSLLYCLTGGLAISSNWFLFIWAVLIGRVVETSLGYFITPLMNVLFGALFLRERLTRWQFASVLLAGLGVLNLTFGYGRFPWIAVLLCASFGLYGLLRKKSGTAAIPGLFIETILLLPHAIKNRTRSFSVAPVGGCRSCSLAPASSPPSRCCGSVMPLNISVSSRSAFSNTCHRSVHFSLASFFITNRSPADISSHLS
jgi:RarD protein